MKCCLLVMRWLLNSRTHSSYVDLSQTYGRSSQPKLLLDGGDALRAPPLTEELGPLTVAEEEDSFSFESVAAGSFPMLQWTATQP